MQNDATYGSDHMETGSTGNLILRYAMPSVFTMVVSSIYNVVDKLFIGNGVGFLGLSATTASTSIMMLISALGAFAGTGASIQLSMALGRREIRKANVILSSAFLSEVFLGLLIVAAGRGMLTPICVLTGAGGDASPYVREYLGVIFLGGVFSCVGTGLIPLIRAQGRPRTALICGCAGSICNCILDPIFIYGLNQGIRGAAIATVLSQLLSALLVTGALLIDRKSGLHPDWRHAFSLPEIRESFRLGFPGFLMSVLMCVMVVVFTNTLKHYGTVEIPGDTAISSLGLSTSIGDLITTISIGMQQGIAPLIAYNHAANLQDRVKKILWQGGLSLFAILLVFWAVIELCPASLIQLFGEAGNMEFAIYTVRVYNLALPLLVVQLFGNMYLQATGQVKQASVVAMARNVFFGIPLLLILPVFWGVYGAMAMGPVSDVGGALISVLFTARAMRRA